MKPGRHRTGANAKFDNEMNSAHLPFVDVSVVIVCLNALAHLKETLDSLAALPEPKPRVYVVDGSSTDGTRAYLERSVPPLPLAGWISERDSGIYDAMNKGWNMAAEDSFILYLGAGDKLLSLPSRAHMTQDHKDGTDIIIGTLEMPTFRVHSMWYSDMLLNNLAHHQTLMIHKSLWPQSPFDTSFKIYGDWDFNARLFVMGKKARHYEEFRSYAMPGGVSAGMHLQEAFRVGMRHGGVGKGVHAVLRQVKAITLHRFRVWQAAASSR